MVTIGIFFQTMDTEYIFNYPKCKLSILESILLIVSVVTIFQFSNCYHWNNYSTFLRWVVWIMVVAWFLVSTLSTNQPWKKKYRKEFHIRAGFPRMPKLPKLRTTQWLHTTNPKLTQSQPKVVLYQLKARQMWQSFTTKKRPHAGPSGFAPGPIQ